MNIEDFRYISTIAKLGKFSAASDKLFISQPALSQRVKYIEKEYHITIFTRSANGVKLTEDGACFVRFADEILYSEACLRKQLEDRKQKEIQLIRIGTSQLINTYIFDLLIDTFQKTYPNIKLDIITDTSVPLQKMLLLGSLDLAVIHAVNEPYNVINYKTICADQLVLVPAVNSSLESKIKALGSHIYDPIPLSLLQGETFALPPRKQFLSTILADNLAEENISLNVQCYSEHYDFLYKTAKKGTASTVLLDSYFHPDNDYIPYYYMDAPNMSFPIQICYRKDSPVSAVCDAFTDLVLALNL
ncbi:LysR family transcriptional regulator [uncultured Eubacterium sp.]|uniref:LysR family transcriptional regulator n=1 Tax=uncultured Eubacterium sp. TaxID=165185 RepID=UPI0015AD777F|nr:LysR family transcriptional regulator [uncultured Eubacterium sp.]